MPETQRQGVQMQPPGRAAAVDRIPNDRMADVSQMGTEELVEDELQVGAISGYWSEVVAGTSSVSGACLMVTRST